ncbi:hypothetical protein ABE426_06520 [Sphingobacterium faecium]|uniref:hypothetical protein n=1 Tax=Sphingobacterium faecium TaxID=34087 RepID=UPI003207BBDD
MDKLNESFYIAPWIQEGLKSLPKNLEVKLLQKLKGEKDLQNFNALLSEIKFGIILQKLNSDLIHEKKINSLTPDWTLQMKSSNLIFEVYRLGKSNKDSQADVLYSLIHNKLSNLYYDSYINILIDNNCISNNICIDEHINHIEALLHDVYEWLASNHNNINASKDFGSLFSLNIVKINTGKNHVLCCSGFRIIDQKPHKLMQSEKLRDNEITKKLKKYNEVILANEMPYFLCIDIDFTSGFHYSDFEEHFHHQSAEFVDFENNYNFISETGKEWSILGEFYNSGTRTNLSGLLIIDNNMLKILMNPNKNQRIYDKKFEGLLSKIKSLDNVQFADNNIPIAIKEMIDQINHDLKNL